MAVLDWVVVAMLVASVLLGMWRGLVYEVMSVLNWIAAFVLAQWQAARVADLLPLGHADPSVRYAAGFVLLFVAALFLGGLLAWAASKLVAVVGLRPVDRVLGGLFGVARAAVAVLVLAVVVQLTQLQDNAWWMHSRTAGVATAALRGLKPVVPERFGAYLPA